MIEERDHWEKWDAAVDEYCEAKMKSRLADQAVKANFASRFKAYKGSMGVEEAKQSVHNDKEYLEAHTESVGAEIRMERAKLKLEKIRLLFEEWRTVQANRRSAT